MNDKTLFEQLAALDVDQLKEVKEQISSLQAESVYEETKSKHEHDFDICTHCKKKHVIKSGHNKNTKKPLSSWIMAIECVLNHDKLSVMAEKCGIHKTNAFYWRHKILDRIQEIVNKEHLKGEIQLDETLVPVAFEKGNKRRAKKRGISENKINIACAIDQYGHIRCIVSQRGRITSEALINIFKVYIEKGSTVISDSLRSYHRLMKELKVDWKKIPSKKNPIDGYTLDKINGLHSSIKHYLYSMRGVGAKYLQNYVSLFVYQWEQGEVSRYEIALDLFKELNWNYQGTRNRTYNPGNRNLSQHSLC